MAAPGRTDPAPAVAEGAGTAPDPPGPAALDASRGVAPWAPAELDAATAVLLRSLAIVTCGGRTGRAVFVAGDRAVASLACDATEPAQLTLSEGREYLARVVGSDPGAGVSALEVPGAAVAPIPLGSAAELEPGSEVAALVEEGRGVRLAAVREGGLASVLGVPVLRLEVGRRPMAGPVLERGGRLVALAPRAPIDPGRPSLAVPAEVLASLFPEAPAPGARWEAMRARLQSDDRGALEAFAATPRGTELVAARVSGDRTMDVLVMRRAGARPATEALAASVAGGGPDPACRASGIVRAWRSPAEALERPGTVAPDPALAARLRWAGARGATGDLWLGEGELRLECDPAGLPEGVSLRLDGSGPDAVAPALPRAALVMERGRAEMDQAASRRAAEAEEERRQLEEDRRRAEEDRRRADAEAEASWRAAFRQVRDRIAQLEARREGLERERSRAEGNAQVVEAEQFRQLRAAADVELRHAEEDLAELDRQASLAAVPRAWRR